MEILIDKQCRREMEKSIWMNGHNARTRCSSKIDRNIAANDVYLSETVACSLA